MISFSFKTKEVLGSQLLEGKTQDIEEPQGDLKQERSRKPLMKLRILLIQKMMSQHQVKQVLPLKVNLLHQ